MYNAQKYYDSLELDSVLQLLASEASMSSAKETAMLLRPFDNIETVINELEKTDEAYILSAKYATPSFGNPVNPASLLTRAEVGGILNMGELISISESLRIIRNVKTWRENISEAAVIRLQDLFSLLVPNKFLCR